MKSRRSKSVSWRCTTGLLQVADQLVITTVTSGALGKKSIERQVVDVKEGLVAETVADLFSQDRLPGRVVCGIDPRHLFSITCPVGDDDTKQSAEELLLARMGTLEGGLAAGMAHVKLDSRPHVTLAGCARSMAEALHDGLSELKPTHAQLVPVPLALAAMAADTHKRPRRWKTLVRILPGPELGLILLSSGDVPVTWRLFPGQGSFERAAEVALTNLLQHAREDLGIAVIDGVLLHSGIGDTTTAQRLSNHIELPVTAVEETLVDMETMSLALARLPSSAATIDMFASLRPGGGMLEGVPVRAVLALASVIVGSGLWLGSEASAVEGRVATVRARALENANAAGYRLDDLAQEHERLSQEVAVAEAFVSRRLYWADVLEGLGDALPMDVRVTNLIGSNKVQYPSKKATAIVKADTLAISADAFLEPGENAPTAAVDLTQALRASPRFTRYFPRVQDASLRNLTGRAEDGSDRQVARMSIMAKSAQGK